MDTKNIRLLRADEIECRVGKISAKGLSLLLYKDARVDQRILDETFGPFGWKRSHQSIDGNLYCTVEIRDSTTGEWVAKQDVGAVGYAEKEKSQASDSFKRACFNWGIGRELYSAPFIWVPATKAEIYKRDGREEKYCCNEHFSVASITYNDAREITALSIIDGKGWVAFEWRKSISIPEATAGQEAQSKQTEAQPKQATTQSKQAERLTKNQMDTLEAELQRTGVGMDAVKERYRVEKPEQMTAELYEKVMKALAKTKSADAA